MAYTIDQRKDVAVTVQPLLLYVFTFSDGTVLRVSTRPLDPTEGNYAAYGGNSYLCRVKDADVGAVQMLSEQGIDHTPSVAVHLADADRWLWVNYELAHGFKGATLTATLVLWDAETGEYSSDSIVKFSGICDAAQGAGDALEIRANAKTNLTQKYLPPVPIQRRCPWLNPITEAQRAEANDEDSPFYECGETRDTTTAPPCQYTTETCTQPLRRGNITFDPPRGGRSREYVSGQWLDIRNNANDAKYGDYFPMIYGTAWVEPPSMNVVGDGNYTAGECVVSVGQIGGVLKCVVNDIEVPPSQDISGNPYIVTDKLLHYKYVNTGDRDGLPNNGPIYDSKGDPYGSLACIQWTVPKKVADASSTPSVRVLVQGPKLRVYTDETTYSRIYTENPIWILADVLTWGDYRYDDLDIASFVAAAAICDELISYTDQNGTTAQRKRYTCSLALRQRRSIADVVSGIRRSCNAVIVPNDGTGKLKVFVKRTLADQQPAPVAGSNWNYSPVASKRSNGTAANGYVAYCFNADTIVREGERSTLRLYSQPIAQSPNRVSFSFQDSAYEYAPSSMTVVDPDDVARVQQEVASGTLSVDGVTTYSQAHQIGKVLLAETHRGNESGDTRGTRWFECVASMGAARLRVGHICLLNEPAYEGITNQLVRITRIQPTNDHETVRVAGHFHDDRWYTDAYGTAADPLYSGRKRDRLPRPSYPWAPYGETPITGDSMFAATESGFALEPVYEIDADGATLVKLKVSGRMPVNDFASLKPPLVKRQGTASAGGSLPGGGWVYYVAIVARDADGKLSPMSNTCEIPIVPAGSNYQVAVPVVAWDATAVGYSVFAGTSPSRLTWQSDGLGRPSSVALTTYAESTWGGPDTEFDRIVVKMKRIWHAGVFGVAITQVEANSLIVTAAGWTPGQWVGRDCSIMAIAEDGPVPIADFRVTANTEDTLTVTPDPLAAGIQPLATLIMRSTPTVSELTLSDALWANSLANATGLNPDEEKGRVLRFIAGPGRGEKYVIASNTETSITVVGPWITTPTSASRYVIEEANWLPEQADSLPVNNSDPEAAVELVLPVSNYKGAQLLLMAYTQDGGGNESIESLTPVREVYLPGQAPGIVTITGNYTASVADRTILVNTAGGNVTVTLLPAADYKGRGLLIKKISADENTVTIAPAESEQIEGAGSYVLTEKSAFIEITAE